MSRLSRREFFQVSSTGAAVAASATAAASRPNVLLIMADQFRWDAMGVAGNPVIRTPNLDALAAGGTRFTECWAQHPVCMPSRASIFTGRYPSVHGVRSNGVPLPRHETTMAQVFLKNGYRTGGAGKFHFIPHFHSQLPLMESHPDPYYGFEEFHIGEDQRRGEQAVWMKRYHPEYAGKPDNQIPVELHNSYWAASHTIDFIRRAADRGEPFFAFCSFVDPHHAYNPPAPYGAMYKEKDMPAPYRRDGEHDGKPPFIQKRLASMRRRVERVRYNRTQYYGEVTLIDDSIGRILKALDEYKVRENTLILFIPDHGDLLGDHDLFYKGPLHYRGCANLVWLANWPGHVKAGQVVEGLVQEIDVFPTIAELAGLPRTPGVQGRSQAAVLRGETADTGYSSILIEYGLSGERGPQAPKAEVPDLYTLRTRQWRMSYYPTVDYGELYDLETDPHEYVNRWNDAGLTAVRRRLKDELLARIAGAHDPLPIRERPY